MSDDRTPIPVLRKATKDLQKAARNEMRFTPNDFQSRVKARFFRRIEEQSHIVDLETVLESQELVVQMAGTDRILKWMEDPAFSSWFLDREYVVDTIHSLQQKAVEVLSTVLTSEDASENDRLKAARMLLELGDQFPGRKSEVRFLDDRLNELSESQTDQEIKQLKERLSAGDSDETK